jgi:O-antigen/teichoic acid export membrane protein
VTGEGVSQSDIGAAKLLMGRVSGIAGSLMLGQFILGVTYVVAARSMGPASLGLVATCVAIGTIGSAIFDLGMTSYQVREIASGNLTMVRARSLTRAKRRAALVLVVPSTLACILIMPTVPEGAVLGLTGWAVWEAQTANSLLRSLEKFSRSASAQLMGRLIGLIVTLALLPVDRPELALSLGLVSSFLVEALIDRVFLGGHEAGPASQREVFSMQRKSMSFGLVSLAGIGQQLDTPVVTAGGGAVTGGIYAGAGRLLGPLLFLSSSLAVVGAPWLARARYPDALRVEERRIKRVALVLSLGPLAAAVAGPVAIPWILGRAFAQSGSAFSVLAVGAALSTINQAIAIILQNRGRERSVGHAISIGLVLGLVSSYGLAVIGGPVWAAVGFTVSQLFILAHMAITMRRMRTAMM